MSINGFGVSGKPLGHQWEIGTIAFGETRLSGVRREHQGVPSGVFEFCPHPQTPQTRHLGRLNSTEIQCSLWCR